MPCEQIRNDARLLHSGSQYTGFQKSGRNDYQVEVELKHVNLADSFLCGYLRIKGLTDDWPDLCTFFEAEIIGPKYPFLTGKWDANEDIDRQHWTKFPSFREIASKFEEENYVYDPTKSDFIYMRWKEHFLVPDHRIKNISGASFAGFYYICFEKTTGIISGIYFVVQINQHHNSEWFQQLHLENVVEKCSGSYEFR